MNPKHCLLRSAPESLGISAQGVNDFIEAVNRENHGLHSFMMLRQGQVVAEGWAPPYRPELQHMLFSISKSFTATAIGIAVEEGILSLEDSVSSFFTEVIGPEAVKESAELKIRHLLTMSTGHREDPMNAMRVTTDRDWVSVFFDIIPEGSPGEHFLYSSACSYLLSAIIQQVTGLTLLEYLQPRLLNPLGITGAQWEVCPQGRNTGGFGLMLTTEDLAKFGQLYLQNGRWNGVQLVPHNWIHQSTSYQISNGDAPDSDWTQGYGYQFWVCRHGAYRADGAFGQFCIVLPQLEVVIVMTGGYGDMQNMLNLVWQHLLPAIDSNTAELPLNISAQSSSGALQLKLNCIDQPQWNVEPAPSSPLAPTRSGKYIFPENKAGLKSLQLSFGSERTEFEFRYMNDELKRVSCTSEDWLDNPVIIRGTEGIIAATGAWIGEASYQSIWLTKTGPYIDNVICRFSSHKDETGMHTEYVDLEMIRNYDIGANEPVRLQGTRCAE